MSEQLDLFSEPEKPLDKPEEITPKMTADQRAEIRVAFAHLGLTTAREQFDLIGVLIGTRLNSATDLDAKSAALLIPRLRKRVDSRAKSSTGSSWDDREEETWIDKL